MEGHLFPSPVHAPSPSFICPLLHLENSKKHVTLLAWLSATPRDLLGIWTQRAQADADALGVEYGMGQPELRGQKE